MRKALLLHWWEGTSEGCWFPWLKKELESLGYNVFVPDLPNTEKPVFEEQIAVIQKYSKDFSEWDIIVGHSLWCCLTTQFVEINKLQKLKIILVAPVYPKLWEEIKDMLWEYYDILQPYYTRPNTFETLENSYTILLSDNDPYVTEKSAKEYYDNFAQQDNNWVEYKLFHNWYHFSDWAPEPIKQIPEILNYIK